MEKITTTALHFLKGESRTEPLREVNLSSLLESECADFAEVGQSVTFTGEQDIHLNCRPEALARATLGEDPHGLRTWEAAVQSLARMAGDRSPWVERARCDQAQALEEAGRRGEALSQVQAVIDRCREPSVLLVARTQACSILRRQGQADAAFAVIEPVLGAADRQFGLLREFVGLYLERGERDEARALLRRARTQWPDSQSVEELARRLSVH